MTEGSTIRTRLLIEYDGTDFRGWQVQPGQRTVQGEMERVLRKMCGRPVGVTGSGRTDSGVHAAGQVAHVDLLPGEMARVSGGLSSVLPGDVTVLSVSPVPDDFHARFSAVSRLYRYRLVKVAHPLTSRFSHAVGENLDTERMRTAAELSIGRRDWRAMAKEGGGNSDWMVNVIQTSVSEDGLGWTLLINANRFLRGLVRIWAGTLVRIGSGGAEPELISHLLGSGDRSSAGASLPARGLTLLKVRYG